MPGTCEVPGTSSEASYSAQGFLSIAGWVTLCYHPVMNTREPASSASFAERCRAFEQVYGMPSDEFMRRFEAGELGDDAVYFDWYAAKRGLDVMRAKGHGTDCNS